MDEVPTDGLDTITCDSDVPAGAYIRIVKDEPAGFLDWRITYRSWGRPWWRRFHVIKTRPVEETRKVMEATATVITLAPKEQE